MSERTYAPRSGGRTVEQSTSSSTADARRRTPAGTEGDARGVRRRPGTDRTTSERDTTSERSTTSGRDSGRAARGRESDRAAVGRAVSERSAGRAVSERSAGRAGSERSAGRAVSDREVAGRVASERREPGRAATAGAAKRTSGGRTSAGRTSAAGHTSAGGRVAQGVGGPAAPVQGTAALKLDAAGTEPLRVTDTAAAAPRLRVAPPAPIVAPRTPFIALVIALVVAGVLGILLINTKTNENSFQIDTLQDQQAALDNQQQELDNQLAVYNSAGNLDAAAKRQGLVKAEAPAYIRLPDGRVIGVPKPASGRPAVTAQDADDVATAPQGPATAPAAAPNTPTGVTQGEVQNGGAQPDAGAAGPGAAGPDAAGSGAAGSGAAGSGAAGSGAAGSGAALPGAGQ